ncbi:uncharacterized protein [Battus philenor]|uniref:uncharacterized protein n=1 Tax=Battus philenor TaxID=42288 RepID=UPI0035CEFB07
MASSLMRKELVVTLKKEIFLNVKDLGWVHPISTELHRYIFKENGLEKPTQNLFDHLTYYLVNIIDPHIAASLPWPLYDAKTKKGYRTELSNFISIYSSKGHLSSVMSSYLVNPGSLKVIMLLFQLSQLAVDSVLTTKLNVSDKELLNEVIDKYKSKDEFTDYVQNLIENMISCISNMLNERKEQEKIAKLVRDKIIEMEAKLQGPQKYIDNIVDAFIEKSKPDETAMKEILKIKNVKQHCIYFDIWLTEVDDVMTDLEMKWDNLITPLLKSGNAAYINSKELLSRHSGEIDKNLFTMEYNPKTDAISTKELEQYVNSEQKYILKNIEKDGKLYLPNLIRGFLIAISFILKDITIDDDIYQFNKDLVKSVEKYSELVSAMRTVITRVDKAESMLQVNPVASENSLSFSKEFDEIPPLPDLSSLKSYKGRQCLSETFTPLCPSKHQFDLMKREKIMKNFMKPPSNFLQNIHLPLERDDFLKSITASCSVGTRYEMGNSTQNFQNYSLQTHYSHKADETIAERRTGFTKEHIARLFSTKKSSSSKKFKHKTERSLKKLQGHSLFNESIFSNESSGLFRSHSSPNLFEHRERRPLAKLRARKLSIMKEDSPDSILDVSGIALLGKSSNPSTPPIYQVDDVKAETSHDLITCINKDATNDILYSPFNLMKEKVLTSSVDQRSLCDNRQEIYKQLKKTGTPKTEHQPTVEANSLEKIINRFKRLRANMEHSQTLKSPETNTNADEKRHEENIDVSNANRSSLPDVIHPSFNTNVKSFEDFDSDVEDNRPRKPRESLGTVLGVDATFLDQFELSD